MAFTVCCSNLSPSSLVISVLPYPTLLSTLWLWLAHLSRHLVENTDSFSHCIHLISSGAIFLDRYFTYYVEVPRL